MPKRTHQPKVVRRARRLGFRARMGTKIVKSRRAKGRVRLTA